MIDFSIIEVDNSKWTEIIARSHQYDFYHTQCYHLLENNGRSILCVAESNEDFIALPLVIRQIPDTIYFDCTSVYGYCGPLSNLKFHDLTDDFINFFQIKLLDFFRSNNIITAFSRLHPLIFDSRLFNQFGEVADINKTVAIDLQLSPEQQRQQYRKSNKSEINQLKRKGFYVEEASSNEDVDDFIKIYNETMKRVGASEYYFFDKPYFDSFIKNNCFTSKLLLVKKDESNVAGAIFTISGKIMQYHLAGTTEEYIRDTPMKLLLDEARMIGNDLELDFLHLGGGVGGSDEDSLFRFKAGFSDFRAVYRIWKLVVNNEVYQSLISRLEPHEKLANFFPLYRYKK